MNTPDKIEEVINRLNPNLVQCILCHKWTVPYEIGNYCFEHAVMRKIEKDIMLKIMYPQECFDGGKRWTEQIGK